MGLFHKDEKKAPETVPWHFAYFAEREGRQVAEEQVLEVPCGAMRLIGGAHLTLDGLEWCRDTLAEKCGAKVVVINSNILMRSPG